MYMCMQACSGNMRMFIVITVDFEQLLDPFGHSASYANLAAQMVIKYYKGFLLYCFLCSFLSFTLICNINVLLNICLIDL